MMSMSMSAVAEAYMRESFQLTFAGGSCYKAMIDIVLPVLHPREQISSFLKLFWFLLQQRAAV